LSQVGTSPDKTERDSNIRNGKPKTKPTLMERLEAGKQKAAKQGQNDAHKNKEPEV
jgi:hypothetical protein